MTCLQCSREIDPQSLFCPFCGAPVASGEDPTVAAADLPTVTVSAMPTVVVSPAAQAPARGGPGVLPATVADQPDASSRGDPGSPGGPMPAFIPATVADQPPASPANFPATVRDLPSPPPRAADPNRSDTLRHGRFIPGTLLGDRFRIIAMLGRGGMGEVFRADDLKLGQGVALKFLPRQLTASAKKLERLHGEVRVARQVAHPNVCRVYDIGEIAGETFLTMEYIEGENLSTLLKRIGKLPEAKAIEIARQLCAGVAAAHERGILHRDLKPANIMLDERGMVRITDFGLAALVSETGELNAAEGTPAYMAPEQISGEEVSPQSDIYSLGLILYELFTGVAAFNAPTVAAILQQRASAPAPPSAVFPGIDPAIEQVILDCLEYEPRNRPASALEIAARLPGHDAISAALSAGQTPSPDLVAAAAGGGPIPLSLALACLAVIVAGIALFAYTYRSTHVIGIVSLPQPPEVLASKARETAARFGYAPQPYRAWGFIRDADLMRSLGNSKDAADWETLAGKHPPGVAFWYRESQTPLVPMVFLESRPSPANPPPVKSGMVTVVLDPDGNLRSFMAVPPQLQPAGPVKTVDFSPAFELAGLDAKKFDAATSDWTPLAWGDTRTAWSGRSPERGIELRIEAAASGGRIIYFDQIAPWTRPARDEGWPPVPLGRPRRILTTAGIAMALAVLAAAVFLARRNFRLGRGDRRGAFRVAIAMFAMILAGGLLNAVHVASAAEFFVVISIAAIALFLAAVVWLLYIALEPYLRRRWPHALITWNRVLIGRFRDPLVARDVLIGVAGGLLGSGAFQAIVLDLWGRAAMAPEVGNLDALLGPRHAVAALAGVLALSLPFCFANYLTLMVLRMICRRTWIAGTVYVLIYLTLALMQPAAAAILIPVIVFEALVYLYLYLRIGLVSVLAATSVELVAMNIPMTAEASSFYFPGTFLAAGIVIALAVWSFRLSLGGRPLLSEAALQK